MDTTRESDLPALVTRAHALYCELTGQNIVLRFHWQRSWYELLRCGFTLEEVRCVVRYLQKEIRHERRNIGALKLSNLLQPDRFEEDLNISRARLQAPRRKARRSPPVPSPSEQPMDEQEISAIFEELRQSLRTPPGRDA